MTDDGLRSKLSQKIDAALITEQLCQTCVLQDFTFDVFLRQQWVDTRLDHGINETIYLSNHVIEHIWMPDSYFVNAKDGQMHDVTSSNIMIMLEPGGVVKYNAR